MDPGSWMMAASAVVGAIGAMDSANASASNYNAQAQAAQTNATIARNNAAGAQRAANANEEASRRKSAYALSQQRAAIGQSGVAFEGSPLDVLGTSAANAEMDALNIRYQGQVQANNYLNQGMMSDAQASAATQSASNAEDAGELGAATSLLSGGAKIVGRT
jgi:hypothetical protein